MRVRSVMTFIVEEGEVNCVSQVLAWVHFLNDAIESVVEQCLRVHRLVPTEGYGYVKGRWSKWRQRQRRRG
jgi:hypothetical protein